MATTKATELAQLSRNLIFDEATLEASGFTAAAATAANSGVTAGSYGSSTEIPVLTVSVKGIVTAASTVNVVSLPSQTGYVGAYLKTNGTSASWDLLTTDDVTEGNNLYYTEARFDTRLATKSTDNLTEGANNLYYTTGRFDTRLALKTTTDLTEGANLYYTTARFDTRLATKSTTDLAEGTNLYYTTARWDTRLATKTTDNLTEGTTNLYYTNTRSRAALSAGTNISYDSATGVISATASPSFTDLTISGDLAVNGGDLTTTQTTFNLINATATTLNIGGAATTVSIGSTAHTGTTTIQNDLSVHGSITFGAGASSLSSTTISIDDTLISLADANTADILDIGFYAGYRQASTDYHTGLVRDASDSGIWKLFSGVVAQPTGTVDFTSATYDTLKANLQGNASTVTNGVYTTDTGTVTNTMLAGSIANNKLSNSTISGVSLGSNLNALTIGTGLSGTSYNGSSAVTVAIASTGVTAATYGSSSQIPVIAINAQGQITSASNSSVTIVSDFLNLTDTPNSYTGESGKLVAVNTAGNALEFVAGGANYSRDIFTGNNSTTTFTLSQQMASINSILVFVDSVIQYPVTNYTLPTNSQIQFTDAPATGSEIIVFGTALASTNNVPPDGSITRAKLASADFAYSTFTGTGSQTAFTLTQSVVSENELFVFVSGVPQTPGVGYTASGTTITFTSAPLSGEAITVRYFGAPLPNGIVGSLPYSLTAGTGLSGSTFNGSAARTWSLADSGVAAASYGSSTEIPVLAISAKGVVTSASTVSIVSLPSQTGNAGKYLTTNGSSASWTTGGAITQTADSVSSNQTIGAGSNGFSVGPITIQSGYSVTVASGQRWVII